ncbi:MAG: glucuronate isomerase [Opitutales bacterium]|nr:glucuronate isomerase [Opitutales bacterium]
MKPFIHDDFLLNSSAARELYHGHAEGRPIIDYHCHLSPKDLADNRRFTNLTEIWLEGDHYKWRAMRANGEPEALCSGKGAPYEKFLAFARTVPQTLRNPLHHWAHMELARYFGISELLDEKSAPAVWENANAQLASEGMDSWGILKKFNVVMIGTTDDPTDDLAHHARLAKSACPAKVLPSFRPDKAFALGDIAEWNAWTDKLEAASNKGCVTLADFLAALDSRIDHFIAHGCVVTDHGLFNCPEQIAGESEAAAIFAAARAGRPVSAAQVEAFAGHVLAFLGERYAEKGLVMQLHLGAFRNVNTGMMNSYGPDAGCDSVGDYRQGPGLVKILGELSARGKLPKTILYNLNPADNYLFACMCGNFFEEACPGKMQYGSGWWFLDQMDGMRAQIDTLSRLGLLSRFVGMLTDSRSMMSYCRHEYFRRILCNMLGEDVEKGLVPPDMAALGAMVENISHRNADAYFGVNM